MRTCLKQWSGFRLNNENALQVYPAQRAEPFILRTRKFRKGCAIFVIWQFVKSGLSADDSRIVVLNTAFELFSGVFQASRR